MSKISKYFTKKGESLIFTGDTLEIFVPKRYENHGYLTVEDSIRTIGFFDMIINGKINTGYKLAATIEIIPSETESVVIDNKNYLKLILKKNDVFIKQLKYVEDGKIMYILFYEMTYFGRYTKFLSYSNCATIYDYIAKTTGTHFSTAHTIFELMIMHTSRDSKDIAKPYRLTLMTKDPRYIGLHSIANVASSTSGRIIGSYSKQGFDASLANASENNSNIEDILRQ